MKSLSLSMEVRAHLMERLFPTLEQIAREEGFIPSSENHFLLWVCEHFEQAIERVGRTWLVAHPEDAAAMGVFLKDLREHCARTRLKHFVGPASAGHPRRRLVPSDAVNGG